MNGSTTQPPDFEPIGLAHPDATMTFASFVPCEANLLPLEIARKIGYPVIVKAAAVSDYRPVHTATHKIKKGEGGMQLALERTTDILKTIGQRKNRQIVIGFAAETRDMETHARKKLAEKRLDMIAANLIGPADAGFGADTNRMTLFFADGRQEVLNLMDKDAVADLILDRVAELLESRNQR